MVRCKCYAVTILSLARALVDPSAPVTSPTGGGVQEEETYPPAVASKLPPQGLLH